MVKLSRVKIIKTPHIAKNEILKQIHFQRESNFEILDS